MKESTRRKTLKAFNVFAILGLAVLTPMTVYAFSAARSRNEILLACFGTGVWLLTAANLLTNCKDLKKKKEGRIE